MTPMPSAKQFHQVCHSGPSFRVEKHLGSVAMLSCWNRDKKGCFMSFRKQWHASWTLLHDNIDTKKRGEFSFVIHFWFAYFATVPYSSNSNIIFKSHVVLPSTANSMSNLNQHWGTNQIQYFPTTTDTASMSQEHLGAFTQSAAGCRAFLWFPNPKKIGR